MIVRKGRFFNDFDKNASSLFCHLQKSNHKALEEQLGQLDENLEKLLEKVENQRIKTANLGNEIDCQEKVIIETQRISEETEKRTAVSLEGLGSLATFIRARYLSPIIYVVLNKK